MTKFLIKGDDMLDKIWNIIKNYLRKTYRYKSVDLNRMVNKDKCCGGNSGCNTEKKCCKDGG